MDDFEIRATRSYYGTHIDLFLKTGESIVTNLELKPYDDCTLYSPVVSMSAKYAQQLLDDLWYSGFRPTNVKESNEALDKMNSHLQDMRSIASVRLGIKLKGISNEKE